MNAISVIVPTLNEVDNIAMLVSRIAAGFDNSGLQYEIVFVDDHSTDGTVKAIENLSTEFPVRYLMKRGERGKAHSLLEGFADAKYETLCMIDADLQYPPEAIIPMYRLMESTDTDIVLTNRLDHATSRLRKITSAGFNFIFTKLLFGFDYDSQSGLKLFKRSVIKNITITPTPWSFDLEFIVRSLEHDYKIISYDISFAERYAGVAKIQVSKVAIELAKASVKLRFNSSPRKVKEAYKMNDQNVRRVLTTSLLAFAMGSVLALSYVAPASALYVSPLAAGWTQTLAEPTVPSPAVISPSAVMTYPDESPTPAPESTSTAAPATTAAPAPLPTSTTVPAAQTSGPVSSAPVTASPTSPTPTKATARRPITINPQPTTTVSSGSLSKQSTPVLEVKPSTAAGSIRYPALKDQAKAGYNYPDRQPSAASRYIRPLSFAALVILIISLIGYGFSAMKDRLTNLPYQNPRAVTGTHES